MFSSNCIEVTTTLSLWYLANNSRESFEYFSLLSNQGTGFEVFVDDGGKLVVGVLTKKEFLATTASMVSILDNK